LSTSQAAVACGINGVGVSAAMWVSPIKRAAPYRSGLNMLDKLLGETAGIGKSLLQITRTIFPT
jgi:hypothetical protein